MENALANARLLSKALESTGWYRCVSDIHRPKGQTEYKKGEGYEGKEGETSADYNAGLPVVAFTLTDEFKEKVCLNITSYYHTNIRDKHLTSP
jgi:glutamate decarboxylase